MTVLPEDLQRALRLLKLWRTVRPGTHWLGLPTDVLQGAGLVHEVLTALGPGLVLSPAGSRLLGKHHTLPSETVVANTLYQQDSWPVLKDLGFDLLSPGKSPYRNVRKAGRYSPLLGRFTGHGYDDKTVEHHWRKLEPDLLSRGAELIILHPCPERLTQRPKLRIVPVLPRWQ
ncbi:hypothetical protein Deipr_2494 (plasmid) [Deinococcus proteolyticus MRP]|uniref:Uncharacterized protein n=1 Tax=Deinococcus proteolyticus (strain ATCC 35074 / DSM 20540 / JCM 6276 / NBRC 101906 / NCIMB 13154 / VKM Ac-1939 / CCM 2703 / MRP) TaxID=693977 RepID=F0RQQ2_DEIPM|nr:hypothetical protein [Deinococcus proteolyticus]ADY27611.1 hypothetical protein Deipr_2494 [Deinococcus proteolyticus MRP]